ncbi:MAG: hypothetical protein F6J97_06020 [Leptolyngbya sp. SIO4C1]|nr:hypothetical protein [Leptolyngbya sp. SIO4C1]
MFRKIFQAAAVVGLIALLAIGGCQLTQMRASQPQSQWTEVESAIEPATPTAAQTAAVLPGSQFNPFFPEPGEGYERVYTQEKAGFAAAKLKQNGADLAILSVSDTINNPTAATKYQSSLQQIQGYPAIEIGSTGTGVLLNDRIQVKVLSRSERFTPAEREAWLKKFDLAGLAQLAAQ